jgi:hypothetical protein
MMIRWARFNTYLLLAAALGLSAGCNSDRYKRNRALSTFRVHLEAKTATAGHTQTIQLNRQHPVSLRVDQAPFLTEKLVKGASVADAVGGFVLRIEFDRQGTWLLEQCTTANRGSRLAVFSQFPMPPEQTLNAGRWLAAPRFSMPLTNGVLTFTPDATRAEADQIVLGLTHVAERIQRGQATE